MRIQDNQTEAILTDANSTSLETAFEYLKSLPANLDRAAIESYKRGRTSAPIPCEIAESFTTSFRRATSTFTIPVSWTMTKEALINLLGITSYSGHEAVNGVRFYAGVNPDNQMTLIAVSTTAGTGCNDDLTVADSYPYYDYCDPCPTNCTNVGNLKSSDTAGLTVSIVM